MKPVSGLWMASKRGDSRLRVCFGIAVLFHSAIFVGGSLGLGTRVEYGMKGQVAMSGGAPSRLVEEQTVSLEDDSDDAVPARRKAKPTPIPTPQTGGTGGVSRSGATDLPSYLQNPPPPYPEEARRAKQEGTALVWVGIGSDGNVTGVRIEKSSGYALLDQAAVETVGKWRFKPARMAGIAVSTEVMVPIRFQLEGRQ